MKKLMTDLVVDEEFCVEDTHIYKSMMECNGRRTLAVFAWPVRW